jgi:hypothetical protein
VCHFACQVGVVAFSTEARSATSSANAISCGETELATAVPHNKKFFETYISRLFPRGDTHYSKAFDLAFDFFTDSNAAGGYLRASILNFLSLFFISTKFVFKSHTGHISDKVILFLTDGKPSDRASDIHDTISLNNAKFRNKVVIMTFGLGSWLLAFPLLTIIIIKRVSF